MDAERRRERTRQSYFPPELRVLFIGESPPTGGTFFYDANSVLYRATRDAFVTATPKLAAEDDFRPVFQRLGCYLDDLSLEPIDKLPAPEKRQARTAAMPDLARRLRKLQAPPRRIVVVVKGIEAQVKDALAQTGFGDVPLERPLPFPGQWHRNAYVGQLTELVLGWRRWRLLLRAG